MTFADIIKRLEKVSTPRKITFGGTLGILFNGTPDIRFGIWTNLYRNIKQRIEKMKS